MYNFPLFSQFYLLFELDGFGSLPLSKALKKERRGGFITISEFFCVIIQMIAVDEYCMLYAIFIPNFMSTATTVHIFYLHVH